MSSIKALLVCCFLFASHALAGAGLYDTPMTLSLCDFRTEAESRLSEVFGDLGQDEGKSVFQDGYASDGPGRFYDMARVYYLKPFDKDLSAAYYISPQGFARVGFATVSKDHINFIFFSLVIVYKEGTSAETIAVKAAQLAERHSSLIVYPFQILPMITIDISDIDKPTRENALQLQALIADLESDAGVDYWERSGEYFPIPYGFAPTQSLETLASIDINSLRSLTKDLLNSGQSPTVTPRLPEIASCKPTNSQQK